MTKVHIRPSLLQKMDYIVNNVNIEIGAYLTGEVRAGEIYLEEMLIPDQIVSATHVDISPDAQFALRRKYKDKVFKILGHFHSHHQMGAFWSGTDLNNMSNIMENKKLFVFVVGSTSNYLVRVSIRDPISLDIDNVELSVNGDEFNAFINRVKNIVGEKNIKMNITKKPTGLYDRPNLYGTQEEVDENREEDELI